MYCVHCLATCAASLSVVNYPFLSSTATVDANLQLVKVVFHSASSLLISLVEFDGRRQLVVTFDSSKTLLNNCSLSHKNVSSFL